MIPIFASVILLKLSARTYFSRGSTLGNYSKTSCGVEEVRFHTGITLDHNNARAGVVRYLWFHACYSSALARLHGALNVGASGHGLAYNANFPLGGGPISQINSCLVVVQ